MSVEIVNPDQIVEWLNNQGLFVKAYSSAGNIRPKIHGKWLAAENEKGDRSWILRTRPFNSHGFLRYRGELNLSIELQDSQSAPVAIEIWTDAEF